MKEIIYILILIVILVALYYIFIKKETFINRKLENFNGDDLNVHGDGEYNINTEDTTKNIIE
jgi:hypothetical protein